MENTFLKVYDDMLNIGLGPIEILISSKVRQLQENDHECYISDKRFADMFGVGTATVSRAISRLNSEEFYYLLYKETKTVCDKGQKSKERILSFNHEAIINLMRRNNQNEQSNNHFEKRNNQNDCIKDNIKDNNITEEKGKCNMEQVKRKCAHCEEIICTDYDNLNGILKYDNKYYHTNCFKELCSTKLMSKRCKKEKWETALNNIGKLESQTKNGLCDNMYESMLVSYLIDNYKISKASNRFYITIHELSSGKYRGKICKPISTKLLFNAWKWAQSNLDNISKYNKSNNKGPTNDVDRVLYDLAIVIDKIPIYLSQLEEEQTMADKYDREAEEYFANMY